MVKYGYNFTFFDFKYNDIEFSLVDFYYIFRSSTLNHKNEISTEFLINNYNNLIYSRKKAFMYKNLRYLYYNLDYNLDII